MVSFGPLTAETCWRVSGTPANFYQFRILALLLHRRRSIEVNKTLQDVWPSPGLVHYIYILGVLAPNGILPATKFTLHPSLAFSYIASIITAWHSISGRQPNFVARYKNGITELSQRAPPIFGWAAIALGTGPYSSYQIFLEFRFTTFKLLVARLSMNMKAVSCILGIQHLYILQRKYFNITSNMHTVFTNIFF